MYDKITLDTFIKKQLQLFPEVVAETPDEAEEFLDECCAVVCKNYKEVKEYMEEEMDITGMTKDEILASEEVFDLGDGRYLVVEG